MRIYKNEIYKSSIDNFIYLNTIGSVFEKKIVITKNNKNIILDTKNIEKIVIRHKRNYTYNFIFLTFILCLTTTIYTIFNELQPLSYAISTAGMLLVGTKGWLYLKKYDFTMVVVLENRELELGILKNELELARRFVSKSNRQIRLNHQNVLSLSNTI